MMKTRYKDPGNNDANALDKVPGDDANALDKVPGDTLVTGVLCVRKLKFLKVFIENVANSTQKQCCV